MSGSGESHPGGERNTLLFSNATDAKVLFEENGRLRVAVDEHVAHAHALEERVARLVQRVDMLEDEKLTMRGTGIPKVNLHNLREELNELKAENHNLHQGRDTTNAANIALNAEVRRLREAYMGKDTLLTARGRALERSNAEIADLQRQLVVLKEKCKGAQVDAKSVGEWDDVVRDMEEGYKKEIHELRVEVQRRGEVEGVEVYKRQVEELEGRLAQSVTRHTMDGWDDMVDEMETAHRQQVRELKEGLSAAKKHEAHARAAVQVAHSYRRSGLCYQEYASRAEVEAQYYRELAGRPPAHPTSKEIRDIFENHLATFRYLGEEFKKSRILMRHRLIEEVRSLLDKAYEDGYNAGAAKTRKPPGGRQNQSLVSEVSDATGTSHSSVDNMQLFETVLRRSPATEIASALARCGLKVMPSPAHT